MELFLPWAFWIRPSSVNVQDLESFSATFGPMLQARSQKPLSFVMARIGLEPRDSISALWCFTIPMELVSHDSGHTAVWTFRAFQKFAFCVCMIQNLHQLRKPAFCVIKRNTQLWDVYAILDGYCIASLIWTQKNLK